MAGRGRWERVLLVVAVLLGVVAMHATVAPGPSDATTSAIADTAMGPEAQTPVGHPGEPMPVSHQLLHLCLAVLAAATALGLAAVASTILIDHNEDLADPYLAKVVPAPPRPPPRTAVRLAELCVQRN